MSSYTSTRNALRGVFPAKTVQAILDAMADQGITKRGPSAVFSPHNCIVATLACCLPEPDPAKALLGAMKMRDWGCVGVDAGRRLAPGMKIEGLRDVKLARTMISEVVGHRPGAWLVHPTRAIGRGLQFGPYAVDVSTRPVVDFVSIPQFLLESFARHQPAVQQSQQSMNSQFLARISRSLRPAAHQKEAAE